MTTLDLSVTKRCVVVPQHGGWVSGDTGFRVTKGCVVVPQHGGSGGSVVTLDLSVTKRCVVVPKLTLDLVLDRSCWGHHIRGKGRGGGKDSSTEGSWCECHSVSSQNRGNHFRGWCFMSGPVQSLYISLLFQAMDKK